MRIRWTEKAARLAEKYDLKDMNESDIIDILTCRNNLKAVGVIDEGGKAIWWFMKEDKQIDVEVEMNPRIGVKLGDTCKR